MKTGWYKVAKSSLLPECPQRRALPLGTWCPFSPLKVSSVAAIAMALGDSSTCLAAETFKILLREQRPWEHTYGVGGTLYGAV